MLTATVTRDGLAEIERAVRTRTTIRESAIDGAVEVFALEIEESAERGEEWSCELPSRLTRSGHVELLSIDGVSVVETADAE